MKDTIMTDNNTIAINYFDEKLRFLVMIVKEERFNKILFGYVKTK